ncbi:universal stress protein [Bacillus benzoevorans]|uniref:Nucleotide-binding universal stress UspA family protein n=1 Tax=Bacillus benzoevorans TaxID=1456 RepID=A0A7X0LVU2_9BACI|nr:universal stress protein [Bacillus benzoevorans]MBB6446381.1 nucleotide-binding universal stress UspA family protein [Bacillus benzoevorans]
MFKKILLAADGSEHALRAAGKAAEIAKLAGPDAIIEIVYVVDFETEKNDVLRSIDQESINEERKRRLQLTEGKISAADVNSKTIIKHGEPGQTIVTYANENDFDLVVLGSRGLNALQEMVLGGVSHKVVKRVKCPVMIVK